MNVADRRTSRAAGIGLIIAAALLIAQPTAAQTGEDALRFTERAPGTGVRAMGMAGIGIAGLADYSSIFTNPAGLAYLRTSQLAGGLSALSVNDQVRYQTAGFTGFDENDLRRTRLSNLAYFHKFPTSQGSLVVGAAFNQVNTFDRNLIFGGPNSANSISDSFLPFSDEFEIVEDQSGNLQPRFFSAIPELAFNAGAIELVVEDGTPVFWQAVLPGTEIQQNGDVLEEGRMNELSFGGALEASPGVMVGLSANFNFGTYRFNSLFEEDDFDDQNRPEHYFIDQEGLEGFDFLRYEQGFESDLTGFNLRGGVSTEVARGVRLGLTVETPTFFVVNETFHRELETFFDIGGSLFDREDGEFEYEITTPWRLGAGGSWTNGDLLLGADVEYVDWSQLELDSDHTSFDQVNRSIRTSLDPVFNTRLGAEYRLGAVAFRGGFAYQPDPRSATIEHAGVETDRTKTFFSAGLGYQFADNVHLDFAWMQERFDDLYTPYGDVESLPPVAEEDVVRNRISLGVRIGF